MNQRSAMVLGILLLAFGVASWGTGCGTAEAAPVDVTYYYLPG